MTETTGPNAEQEPCMTNGTISIQAAAAQSWDVIVIGAGPAGSMSARQLAGMGRSVLLIEAKKFPRNKVCGGCLNARTLNLLARVGLGSLPVEAGGVPYSSIQLFLSDRSAKLPLPQGISISRYRFDPAMLSAALKAGCQLLSGATATVLPQTETSRRVIMVHQDREQIRLTATCVVCADGLRRVSARQIPEMAARVAPQSHVGWGTSLSASQLTTEEARRIPPGEILMAVGPTGYVGMVRAEHEGLSVAATVNPAAIKAAGSAAAAISHILEGAGLPRPGLEPKIGWTGTMPLTSAAGRVAAERLFVVGDAASYVEPFTGEGIAAALESAWLVAPLVDRAVSSWDVSLAREWEKVYGRSIRRRQWICRGASWFLRHPSLLRPLLPWISRFPAVARPVVARINKKALATAQ